MQIVRARDRNLTIHAVGRSRSGTMTAPLALTGVPGTGKTTAAALLPRTVRSLEVAELARNWGAAKRSGRTVTVDLEKLARMLRARRPPCDVLVGHLAHLLPVRDVVVLRCHPEVLAQRLMSAGRGSPDDRRANYLAEALDVVLVEAVRPGRRVWEVDTTGRSPAGVARTVARLARLRPPSRYGSIDWLADPLVTEHLLESRG